MAALADTTCVDFTRQFALPLLLLTFAAPLPAATLSWSSAGENYEMVRGPFQAAADNGTAVAVSHEGPVFARLDQSNGWYGNFRPFEQLLWTYYGGAITLDFGATRLQALSVQIQPDLYGEYTALLEVFDSTGALITQTTRSGESHSLGDGSAVTLNIAGAAFHSVRISLLEGGDPSSFAVGTVLFESVRPVLEPPLMPSMAGMVLNASAVPEPSTVALLLTGAAFLAVCAAPARRKE
jgi:hypothetical protein